MQVFQINYQKLVLLLLPVFLRKERLFAFLRGLTAGVACLHGDFLFNRTANLRNLTCNGQVCRLEGLLNDEFDPELRRIRIDDAELEGDWFHALEESAPGQLFAAADTMLYSETLIVSNTAVFYVFIPFLLTETDKINRLQSLLNKYTLASKQYIITTK